jgi:tripartite-type tricarboxylate transporter receptor subunit TctC
MKIGWISRMGLCLVLSMVLLVSTMDSSFAQTYPTKPIRIIVPFAPGGGSDILSRILGPKLTKSWGQSVIVDNRGGAGGIVGTEMVAKAPPDGYTLTMGYIGTHAINPSLYPKLSYDPVKDFAPVALVAAMPNILVVHPSLPVKSVQELIALAKSKPGELNYGSGGVGTAPHLAGELFNYMAGVKMVHIPYKGSGPALTELLGGHLSLMFNTMVQTTPHVKADKLRGLGVTSAKRSAAIPELPTIAESGLPGYEMVGWFGVLAPAGTPKEIVTKLNIEINKILNMPDVKELLVTLGSEPTGITTPEQFGAFIKAEITKWAKVVKESGMKPE